MLPGFETVTEINDEMNYSTLLVEQRDSGLLIVTLNRPDEGNAVNTQMGIELLDFWTGLVRDREDSTTRCVVLIGAGEAAFCAGGDMKERDGMSAEVWRHQHEIFEQALWMMMECPVPVIAAVTGKAFGATEALEWGIFSRVCSTADLMPVVIATAESIVGNAPLAVRQAKKAIHQGLQMDVRSALRFEVEAYNRLTDTEDRREGVTAWNEGRKPRFKAR